MSLKYVLLGWLTERSRYGYELKREEEQLLAPPTPSLQSIGLALLIPATLLVVALSAYLPVRWAALVPADEVLRYE